MYRVLQKIVGNIDITDHCNMVAMEIHTGEHPTIPVGLPPTHGSGS